MTKTSDRTPVSAVPDSYKKELRRGKAPERGTVVYAKSEEGELIELGEIVTSGGSKTFIGDRIIVHETGLIIFNTELNIGVPAFGEVKVVDTLNDRLGGTIGGTHMQQFEGTLECLKRAVPGEVKLFDTDWL